MADKLVHDSLDGFDNFLQSSFQHREPSPHPHPFDNLPKDSTLTRTPDSPPDSSSEKVVADDCFMEEMESKSDGEDTLLRNQFPPSVSPNQLMKVEDHNGLQIKHEITHIEMVDSDESGTEEDRSGFMHVLETFCKENALEFKPPKFYGEPLNCLKLWRAVTRLGGYDRVTASKLWRQVGESFNPPKTCTTVSWTFRIFYEKALLEYEKHKRQTGELQFPEPSFPDPIAVESEATVTGYKTPGSGRARRDSAARAMQGWHSHRSYDHGEGKNPNSTVKREKHLKSIGVNASLSRQKKAVNMEHADKAAHNEADTQPAATVIDIGTPADWVKINVRETKDCFEVYALVPGLLREEVRVQSDPAGRLVITGQPEQLDNPWGIKPFKKVVNLPARIDPHQTSAVVSLHGRLFVRVPFEQ